MTFRYPDAPKCAVADKCGHLIRCSKACRYDHLFGERLGPKQEHFEDAIRYYAGVDFAPKDKMDATFISLWGFSYPKTWWRTFLSWLVRKAGGEITWKGSLKHIREQALASYSTSNRAEELLAKRGQE